MTIVSHGKSYAGTPRLSIVVPIYGVEKYLRQCVDSILAQTFEDFEVLLVDDGGNDDCPRICDEYAAKDFRVKVVHKKNGGYGSAVNVGLDAAVGDWIGIVEPDDWINTNMYAVLMDVCVGGGVDVVKANFVYVDGEKTVVGLDRKWCGGSFLLKDAPWILQHHPSIWSCVYRRDFLHEFSIRMKEVPGGGWVDNLFQIQTMCLARKIFFVDEIVYNYRVEGNSVEILRRKGGWRIPFDRSMEIHDWLEEHRVEDYGILASLYERELYYLDMMARVYHAGGEENILGAIQMLAKRFRPVVVRKPWMRVWQRQIVWEFQFCPKLHLLRYRSLWVHRLIKVAELAVGIGI